MDVRWARVAGKYARDAVGSILGIALAAAITMLADKEFVDAVLEAVKENTVLSLVVPPTILAGIAILRAIQDILQGKNRE